MSSDPKRRNQYFVPGDGIAREVITADICKYLDNDAMVRPGDYQGRQGYFIYAYRNLTSEMIQDLQADSQRWDKEKQERARQRHPRGTSGSTDQYIYSRTHHHRQQEGPTNPETPSNAGPPYGPPGSRLPPGTASTVPGGIQTVRPPNQDYHYPQPPFEGESYTVHSPNYSGQRTGASLGAGASHGNTYIPPSEYGEQPRNPGPGYPPAWDTAQPRTGNQIPYDGMDYDQEPYSNQPRGAYPTQPVGAGHVPPSRSQPVHPHQPMPPPSRESHTGGYRPEPSRGGGSRRDQGPYSDRGYPPEERRRR